MLNQHNIIVIRQSESKCEKEKEKKKEIPIILQTIYLSFSRLLSTGPVEDDGREQFL